jgi:hypothetical protein
MSEFDVRYAHISLDSIAGRLIRNPHYGGPRLSLNDWTYRPEISKHGKEGFQRALEESIRADGIRNPILVWSLPEGIFLTFGGSRVRAALSVGLTTCPAIINDYTGAFEEAPLVTPDTVAEFFTDLPRDWEFNEDGFDYHYNLERARRHNYDESGLNWLEGEDPAWLSAEFPWL